MQTTPVYLAAQESEALATRALNAAVGFNPALRHRRYQLPDGRRTSTVELPRSVFLAMGGMAKAQPLLERFARGEATRSRIEKIKVRIKEGVKLTAIAHEFNVSQPTVSRIKKEMGL